MAPRLLVANLDCESEYALAADVTLAPRELELAPAATEASAAIGTLLRVFLDDRDRLWLPAAVDASRVPPVEGVSADPECIHGPLDADTGYRDVLSWGSSTSIDALIKDRARTANAPDLDGPIVDSLWSMPKSPSDIAARANEWSSLRPISRFTSRTAAHGRLRTRSGSSSLAFRQQGAGDFVAAVVFLSKNATRRPSNISSNDSGNSSSNRGWHAVTTSAAPRC